MKNVLVLCVAFLALFCGGCSQSGGMASGHSSGSGFSPVNEGAAGQMHSSDFSSEYRSGVTLVYFAKPACPACAQQNPIFEEAAKELPAGARSIKVFDYMVDDNRYGIQKYPTVMIFKDGRPVWDNVGVTSKSSLLRAVKKQLK